LKGERHGLGWGAEGMEAAGRGRCALQQRSPVAAWVHLQVSDFGLSRTIFATHRTTQTHVSLNVHSPIMVQPGAAGTSMS
jgi:hypothetical protein